MKRKNHATRIAKFAAVGICAVLLIAAAQMLYVTNSDAAKQACASEVTAHERAMPYAFDYSWMEQTPPLIAHAMGGMDGNTYTNCLEAFEYNYDLGHRVFEVDFGLTDPDGTLVAVHDEKIWRQMARIPSKEPFTYDVFLQYPLLQSYTPLDGRDIIDLMEEYPDIYIVTDTKYTDYDRVSKAFSQLVSYANSIDPAILDRLIPQIYHEEMLLWLMDIHPFKSVIYTLYQTSWTPESVYEFCVESGVRFITMEQTRVKQETTELWSELGIQIAAHTCNSDEQIKALFDSGIDMIYTDFALPEDW